MKFYWKYVKPHIKYFIIGPILMMAEVVGEVVLPYLFSRLINNGIPNGNTGYIIGIGVAMIIFTLTMMIGGLGGNYFNAKASISFAADLRKDAFRKVQEYSFANIDQFSTGSLVTRLTNDITQVQNTIRMGLIMLLRSPGMLIGGLIMAVRMNASLAVILAVVIPILAVAQFFILRTGFPRFSRMQQKIDALNSSVQESLTNVRVIKSFVRSDVEKKRFFDANRDLKESSIHAFKVMIMTMPVMMLMMNITTLAVVWFGGNQIIAGKMPVGDLTAFTTYIVQILMSLNMLSMVILMGSRAAASAKRIKEVLLAEVDLTDDQATQKDKKVEQGELEFRNVSFKYYKEKPEYVLENISFRAKPGQIVGIIGSTGSGKTSLVQLIPRLYDTYSGDVLVDGVNVKDYSLHNLRNGVGMVLQKNVLFSGTIEENLEWGDEDASIEEVQAAAKAAQAHDFIQGFTEGYHTELGQGGVNVSGGQKQRLCIARALLKKPKILILDDSTSAVDTATEARIRESFKGSLKDTTKLIIAQRISSVMDADQILVLDEGKIVGKGTHDELLKDCEAYQEIYYSQMDKEATA
ncbi:MAG: ABC transporter ATP-binding protein [Lachnospiraceae bacterium]|jgi:ATP-binding cassette subfamily B multidrug efflux pump|nr:ABC transporter ATP-binding protein [Lachnospiraceae bacterium]